MKQECSPHGWTVDTLETYLSGKIASIKELGENAASVADRAIIKTDMANEKIRDDVVKLSQQLISRVEYSANHKSLEEKIGALQARLDTMEGKSKGLGEGWGVIVAAGGLATGILFAVMAFFK